MLYIFNDYNIFVAPTVSEQELTGLHKFGYNDFHGVKPIESLHTNPMDTLHIVLSGSGTYFLNGKTYKLKRGDMFFTPRDTLMMYPPNKDDPWKYVWFTMLPNVLPKYLPLLDMSISNPVHSFSDFDKIEEMLLSVLWDGINSGDISVFTCLAVFMQILALEGKHAKPNEDTKERYMQSIKIYIETNYTSQDFTVNSLCDMMHLSHSYLCRLFAECEGCTIINYIEELRLKRAAKLLLDTSMNVNQISATVGYHDALHFMKRFKKKYGMTALEYRRQQ